MIVSEDVIYQVSELNQMVRQLLENTLPTVWVEGEISNLAKPSSGHAYFTLKDENAQVRCVLFRFNQAHLNFNLEEGMRILLRARASVYTTRGDFQLLVEEVGLTGEGALRRAFELLKQKLAKEGLFDLAYKKSIPVFPRCIGIITSPIGAAVHDILTVLKKRFPAIPIIIYPTAVQGVAAIEQVKTALQIANQRNECDVLILARGGGTLEDLSVFNEESIARTIFVSHIPIVTGIGHEIDFTIADFVADARAPTPSAAAALVSPDVMDWLHRFEQYALRLTSLMWQGWQHQQHQLDQLEKKLRHPGHLLFEQIQRFDDVGQQLQTAMRALLFRYRHHYQALLIKFRLLSPSHQLSEKRAQIENLSNRLHICLQHHIEQAHQLLEKWMIALEMVSPLATLKRGYAIPFNQERQIVRTVASVHVNQLLDVDLIDGRLICRVERIKIPST